MFRIAKKTIILTTLFLSCVSFASDEVIKNDKQIQSETVKVKEQPIEKQKLTSREKIKIILEEKKRLRSVEDRKKDKETLDLTYFYIRELKEPEIIRGLLREFTFYGYYLLENYNNKEMIKKEIENMSWNAMCLSQKLTEEKFYIYNESIVSLLIDDEEKEEKINKANQIVIEYFKDSKASTEEEIKIRCDLVYK